MTTFTRIPFRRRHVALAIACLGCALPLAAAPVAWSNPGTGDWRTGANWAGGATPGALDDARILNGGTALLNGGLASVRSVEIGGSGAGSTLQLQGAPVTLQMSEGGLLVGRSFAGELVRGTLAAGSGRLDIAAPLAGLGSITVGRAEGGGATGTAVIGSVSADGLATVAVGIARGGQALGELSVLGGSLAVGESLRVGEASSDFGSEAEGRVVLAGALQGRRSGQAVGVGVASGSAPVGASVGQASAFGELNAAALIDLQFVGVGTTRTSRADDLLAEGRLVTGASSMPGRQGRWRSAAAPARSVSSRAWPPSAVPPRHAAARA